MSRGPWILMILLALMMAPTLCQCGMVEHECACTPGMSECSHEAACSDDPCGWVAIPSWRSAPQTPSPIVTLMPLFDARQVVARPGHFLNQRAVHFHLPRRDVETSTIVLVV